MDQGQHGGATVGEYSGALRRRWWVVVLGAVLGLGLAASYLLLAPKTYISTAAVLVNPIGDQVDAAVEGARTNSGVNLDTEAQLVMSQAVSSQAKVKLQTLEIVGQLVQHVSVEVPANTNVLRISFTAGSPEEARDGADAFARAYLDNRRNTSVDLIEDQTRALKQQIAELQAQLPAASADERPGIEASLTTLNTRLSYLLGTQISPGEMISQPLIPRRPASPNAALVLVSGLAFGLLIGLAGLYLLERRDGRCYDWRAVERRLGLAVLADVPGRPGEPAKVFAPHSAGAEAFGQVRNTVLAELGDGPATLVVASPSAGVGADVVAANLAIGLARAGHTTALLVADETSVAPDLFGMPSAAGLTEVLNGRLALSKAVQAVPDAQGLSLLAAGHGLDEKIEDLEGSGITSVLTSLAERVDFLIVRARPSETSADAQFFGRHTQGALPVIEIGRTLRDAVDASVRQWRLVGTAVPGVITVPPFGAPEPAPPRAVTSGKDGDAPLGKASPSS